MNNLKKEDKLKSEAKELQVRLEKEINSYEKAEEHSKHNEETVKELQGIIADTKKEQEKADELRQINSNEIN